MSTTGFFIAAGHLRDRARTWPSVEGRLALLKMARELDEMHEVIVTASGPEEAEPEHAVLEKATKEMKRWF